MTPRETGFLLLTGYLGDPGRKPLTQAQLHRLMVLARAMERPARDRDLTAEDLVAAGCDRKLAAHVVELLSREAQLHWYLGRGASLGCTPITRVTECYPRRLREVLGLDAPGALWCKGDLSLLQTPAVSLVGSRDLGVENFYFAREAGKQAALQGYTLVSGNARGADRTAQDACLAYGGKVISIVADQLEAHKPDPSILYISEEGYDLPFSAQRALFRNRLIHAWSSKVLVAQCTYGKGGTWSGTRQNLQKNWSSVFCFRDGSEGIRALTDMGAAAVELQQLCDLSALQAADISFF